MGSRLQGLREHPPGKHVTQTRLCFLTMSCGTLCNKLHKTGKSYSGLNTALPPSTFLTFKRLDVFYSGFCTGQFHCLIIQLHEAPPEGAFKAAEKCRDYVTQKLCSKKNKYVQNARSDWPCISFS